MGKFRKSQKVSAFNFDRNGGPKDPAPNRAEETVNHNLSRCLAIKTVIQKCLSIALIDKGYYKFLTWLAFNILYAKDPAWQHCFVTANYILI